MIDKLTAAINATMDEAARLRLQKCLPKLLAVLEQWSGVDAAAQGLVVAVATPDSALVLYASDGWPAFDVNVTARIERGDAAMAVVKAVDNGTSDGDVVVNGLAVLLGPAGLLAQSHEALRRSCAPASSRWW